MAIYKANSYNPITSIQAGLREATERGKLAGDKYRADADFWKGATEIGQKFADDMGKVGLNAYDMYVEQNDTPEARLAALEAELAEAMYNEQVEQRNAVNDYIEAARTKGIQDKYNSQVKQRNRVNEYLMDGINTDTFRKPEIPVTYGPSLAETYANDMQGYRPADTGYSTYINAINSAPGVYPEIEDEYRRGIY